MHHDFHSGNILSYNENSSFITDLGLCRPINETDDSKVFGVLPYVAPEVLKGKSYTQSSDVYSLGIMAYEIFSGLPPYVIYDKELKDYKELSHDLNLALEICRGLRPNLDNIPELQLLRDLINSCWKANPLQRPTANEVNKTLEDWYYGIGKDIGLDKQVREARKAGKFDNKPTNFSYQTHPRAIYTSRLLDYKNLPEPQNSKEINEQF